MQNIFTNENHETSTLVGICGANVNENNIAKSTIDKFTISQSNELIVIIEKDTVNIKDTGKLPVNDRLLNSFTVLIYNGMILKYAYTIIQILTAILANINLKLTKRYEIEKETFILYFSVSTLFCFNNSITILLQSTNTPIVNVWWQENKINMLQRPMVAPNMIQYNISSASQSTEIVFVKESPIITEDKSSYSQKDTSIVLYNDNFDDNTYESKLFDNYYMDFNNTTDNLSHITNNEIYQIILNQMHVSGNEYQADENDCQFYTITQLELYLISSKFKNINAAMISLDLSMLNLYTVNFNQIIGTVILPVLAANRRILLNDGMIRNSITYENTVWFDVSANNLVIIRNVGIGLDNTQNNLKDDCDISNICLEISEIFNIYHNIKYLIYHCIIIKKQYFMKLQRYDGMQHLFKECCI